MYLGPQFVIMSAKKWFQNLSFAGWRELFVGVDFQPPHHITNFKVTQYC